MITRILAPLDGCDRAEVVLPYVEELSNRIGAHVTLLHVYPPTLHLQRDFHIQYIQALASQLRSRIDHTNVQVDPVALEGTPNRQIADYAARDDISLIAAAPHSQTSDGHWTVGRTADKVIRETSKPVLLVPLEMPDPTPSKGLLNRILIPLDGSKPSRDVLPHVEAILDKEWGSESSMVWLTHIIPSEYYASGPHIAKRVPYSSSQSEKLRAQASRYLEEVASKLRISGGKIEIRVEAGDVAKMILATSVQVGANLIAMTTHGHSGLNRLFLGSVAERVLHKSTAPLMLVKPVSY